MRGLSWYRRETRPCLSRAGSTEDVLISLRFVHWWTDKGQGSMYTWQVGAKQHREEACHEKLGRYWAGQKVLSDFPMFQKSRMNFSANPIKKDEDQRNRTEVDKTSLFLLQVLCCLLTEPLISDGILSRSRRRGSRPRPTVGKHCWFSHFLLSPPGAPLQPGHCCLFIPFLGPWLESDVKLGWFCYLCLGDQQAFTTQHLGYLGVGCSHLMEASSCFQRNSLFPSLSVLSDCITIRYNVKLVFTAEMQECPHGKFLPLVFLGKKKAVIAWTDNTS